MNTYSPLRWALPAAATFCAWSAFGQTVNPANQINWPQIVGSGAPSASCTASNYGQPYTDNTAHQNYTCGSAGWFLGGGGGGTVTVTSNQGVGANNAAAISPVSEVNYLTTSGNTAFACQEDHNKGDWDVRCIRGGVTWVSNPSQALINTIHDGMCYHFTAGGPMPTVHIPAGSYSIGGNISLPPGMDVEGQPGSQYGFLTLLTTTDSTQAMFTHVSSETFNCSGTNYTANAGMSTLGNVTLHGGGSANAADIGLLNGTGGSTFEYLHNVAFQFFGGPGRTVLGGASGQNARGSNIWANSDLQWYYNSGAYNTSGFTDTNPHCALELGDQDSRWDHVEVTGQLQDSGYYNRYYLCNVGLGGGGQGSVLSESYLQIAPHNVWMYATATGGQRVLNNRLDDGWWDSIHITGSGGLFADNTLIGYCTSPTLNPTNFPSNPGGVSTDPNCAAIDIFQGGLGSIIRENSIGAGGVWSQWPIYNIWSSPNTIGGATTTIDEPGAFPGVIGGQIGGDSGAGNVGADIVRSLHQTTSGNHANAGGAIHFQGYAHTYLSDSSTSNYTGADGIWPDTYVTVEFRGANDTITPGSGITTCSGAAITSGIHWFYTFAGFTLTELCPSGSGGGGGGSVSGLTAGYLPLAGGATLINANSPLDYGVSTAGVVTSSKPIAVADGSGLGGLLNATEGTSPTCVAGQDLFYADATAHAFKFCDNGGGKVLAVGIATVGASGDNVRLASNGRDIVSIGQPASSFTPTFTAGTGAGTGPTINFTSGANDDQGWINVTTGTSPAASAGVVTILYGGTYSAIRKCSVDPANGAAGILTTSGRAYIPVSTSTISQFVITVGTTALSASTTYQWLYRCGT